MGCRGSVVQIHSPRPEHNSRKYGDSRPPATRLAFADMEHTTKAPRMKFNWPRSHNFLCICDACGYRWEQGAIVVAGCPACGDSHVDVTTDPKMKTPVPHIFESVLEGTLDPRDNSGYIHGEPSVLYWHEHMRLKFLDEQQQGANVD